MSDFNKGYCCFEVEEGGAQEEVLEYKGVTNEGCRL
jgi:hypothetical protein